MSSSITPNTPAASFSRLRLCGLMKAVMLIGEAALPSRLILSLRMNTPSSLPNPHNYPALDVVAKAKFSLHLIQWHENIPRRASTKSFSIRDAGLPICLALYELASAPILFSPSQALEIVQHRSGLQYQGRQAPNSGCKVDLSSTVPVAMCCTSPSFEKKIALLRCFALTP